MNIEMKHRNKPNWREIRGSMGKLVVLEIPYIRKFYIDEFLQ